MELFLLRHTCVDIEQGICYGQSDVAVAASFEDEKNQLKQRLNNIRFDVVCSSPLLRCKKLAESLFGNEGIRFDERLKELNFGEWELKTWDEIYNSPEGKIWMENYQDLPTLNGESYAEMFHRVSAFYEELKTKKIDRVVVITHAGVIRIFKSMIEKQPVGELFETFKPPYGSVSKFEI